MEEYSPVPSVGKPSAAPLGPFRAIELDDFSTEAMFNDDD